MDFPDSTAKTLRNSTSRPHCPLDETSEASVHKVANGKYVRTQKQNWCAARGRRQDGVTRALSSRARLCLTYVTM